MTYEYITDHTSPFQGGPRARIASITIHWWDKPERKPTFMGTVNWLCRPDTTASINYVTEAGKVACLVAPDVVAYHAGDGGNGTGNLTSIGIECNPRGSDGDYATVAELVRDLREVYGDLPLYPHRRWTTTECPGTYDLNRINQLAAAAAPTQEEDDMFTPEDRRKLDAVYDAFFNKKTKPGPNGPNKSIVGGEAIDDLINIGQLKILKQGAEILDAVKK